jgi:hypothetical protein
MIEASDANSSTDNDMKRLIVFLTALSVAGCATPSAPQTAATIEREAAVAPTRNAQLADAVSRELAHLARFDPDAVDSVSPELRALADAIMALNTPDETPAAPEAGAVMPADLLPPPADMVDAPSLRHAVHLASYRGVETAREGWGELVSAHGDLLGSLDARLSEVEIAGQGRYLRLKAGPFDTADEARTVCRALIATGEYCAVVDFSGRRMADMASAASD